MLILGTPLEGTFKRERERAPVTQPVVCTYIVDST